MRNSCSSPATVAQPGRLDVSKANPEQKKLILQYAAEVRRFEIERFWQRSTFFWTFIGVALVAFGVIYPTKSARLLTTISAFGGLASFAWTLQNRGSKYWQEAWEQKVEMVEFHVLGARLFSNRELLKNKSLWGAAEFSVSRLAIMVSDLTIVLWVILSITAMTLRKNPWDITFGSVALSAAFGIGLIMFVSAKTDWRKISLS